MTDTDTDTDTNQYRPGISGQPGIDRRAAHADVALLGPEESHTCHCSTCGHGHDAIRREVLFTRRFPQVLATAASRVGAHALLYCPGHGLLGDPGEPVAASRLAPLLAAARSNLRSGVADDDGATRAAFAQIVYDHVDARTFLDRLIGDYLVACETHPSATVSVTLVELLSGRQVNRGASGPFALGGDRDEWFQRRSVIAVGKLRRRQYAGAQLLVRLVNGIELFVFPSKQWPDDRTWLVTQAADLHARVRPGEPCAEVWRNVYPEDPEGPKDYKDPKDNPTRDRSYP